MTVLLDANAVIMHGRQFPARARAGVDDGRRIADDSLPEHAVQADQYIPALVCELAEEGTVDLVTAGRKLQETVREIVARRGLDESVRIRQSRSVLP